MEPHPEPPLGGFDYQPRTRVLFGPGTVSRTGALARELGATRVLLVTDPGIAAAGHADHVSRLLRDAGVAVSCFDRVEENPSTRCVDACLETARRGAVDAVVGLGGGSSMDTAKGCNFLLTNGGRMRDYWGVGKATRPMLPLIAIPTTGGTGSECQSFALITDAETHQKMACGDPKAAARVALLDPELTVSQPPRVTACSGIDAIAHAVETAVTRRRTALSQLFSHEAFRLTVAGFPRVLAKPDDLEARGWMLLGAAWAGTAIENSMLGAAHSAANPLTAQFGITHGHAIALMLPATVTFNAGDPDTAARYAALAAAGGLCDPGMGPEAGAARLAARLADLARAGGLADPPGRRRLPASSLPALADDAASQWTAQFNPRPVTPAHFTALYRAALPWDEEA